LKGHEILSLAFAKLAIVWGAKMYSPMDRDLYLFQLADRQFWRLNGYCVSQAGGAIGIVTPLTAQTSKALMQG